MGFIPDTKISLESYKFTFGKNKGLYLKDVVEEDPNYVIWCMENIEWFKLSPSDEDYVYSLEQRYSNTYNHGSSWANMGSFEEFYYGDHQWDYIGG